VNPTQTIKRAATVLTVGSALAIGLAGPAQAHNEVRFERDGLTVQQFRSVKARAEAVDRYYHLGIYGPRVPSTSDNPSPAHKLGSTDPNV
jgi:hypothetical protein